MTRPGLPVEPGEPAINPVPRAMMRAAIAEAAALAGASGDVEIEVSIPGGEKLAERTLNGRLGIVGGLSISATTGPPCSFLCCSIHTIHRGIDGARLRGLDHVAAVIADHLQAAIRASCMISARWRFIDMAISSAACSTFAPPSRGQGDRRGRGFCEDGQARPRPPRPVHRGAAPSISTRAMERGVAGAVIAAPGEEGKRQFAGGGSGALPRRRDRHRARSRRSCVRDRRQGARRREDRARDRDLRSARGARRAHAVSRRSFLITCPGPSKAAPIIGAWGRALTGTRSRRSTGPTRIGRRYRSIGSFAISAAIVDKLPLTMRSSGQEARCTMATGQSPP